MAGLASGPYGPGSPYREDLDRRNLDSGVWRKGSGNGQYTNARKAWYGRPGICWPYLDEVVEINGGFECNMGGQCGHRHPKICLAGSDSQTTATFEGISAGCTVPQWPIQLRLGGFCGDASAGIGARASFGVADAVQRLNTRSGVPNIHIRVRGDHPEALRVRRQIEGGCTHKEAEEQNLQVCEVCHGLVGCIGEQHYLDAINASGCGCGERPTKRQRRERVEDNDENEEGEAEADEGEEDEDEEDKDTFDSDDEAERKERLEQALDDEAEREERLEQALECECVCCGVAHPDPEQMVADNPSGCADLPTEKDSHGWRMTSDDWSRGKCPDCQADDDESEDEEEDDDRFDEEDDEEED